jgi:twitching motility protein PilT
VGARFDELIACFDRDEVTELVIATGRPIAVREGGTYLQVSRQALDRQELVQLLAGTPIAIPTRDGLQPTVDVVVGRRALRVQVGLRDDDVVVRVSRGATVPALPTLSRSKTAQRAKPQTSPPRARSSTNPPRTKAQTSPPRAKSRSLAPAPDAALAELVARARAKNATDLHVAADREVLARVAGELAPLDPGAPALTAAAADKLLLAALDAEQRARLATVGYVDFAIELGGGRLRANVSRTHAGTKGAFRIARVAPAALDELGLPAELAKVVAHHQGLVVVAGPSGEGKTTTLAALVDLVNAQKPYHIITVEDPIEIVHPRKLAVVSQREAGRHTKNFAAALKASLREDPDVIVIGELRDRETVEAALSAAETGHLVLSTMSTPSAAKTLDRLIDMFPAEEHAQVRASIAGALRAIVAQRLLPANGGGVVPVVELVTGVLPLATLIRDDKLYQLPSLLQRGKAFGMIRFEDSLAELQRAGRISAETAKRARA